MSEVNAEFKAAFKAWIESEKGSIKMESSREIYRSIWMSFASWVGRDEQLLRITSEKVAAYLESRAAAAAAAGTDADRDEAVEVIQGRLTLRYQARVARLIEKVMEHHASKTGVELGELSPVQALMKANPELGAAMLRDANNEPDLDYLNEDEHQRLKNFLIDECAKDLDADREVEWADMRDRASMALQLGAGLTPNDIRELTLDEVNTKKGSKASSGDGVRYIRVPKNGKLSERNVKVDPWAARILDAWVSTLRDRRDNGLSLYVFPGGSKDDGHRQWSKPGQHKQTRKVLAKLDIQGSSFRLRHTWALCKLREGAGDRQVAKWLGVLDGGEVMKRYNEVLAAAAPAK